jgi:opacity protein-like surface antigen
MEHRFTRRSRIEAHARVAQAFARDDPRLNATGALPPMTPTRSESAEVLWRESLTHRLETRVDGRAERFRFDAPGLQDGWTAGARAGLEYSLRRRVGAGVAGEYARTATSPSTTPDVGTPVVDTLGRTFEIASVVATLRLELERHLSLWLEGGAARFQSVLDGAATAASATGPLAIYPPTTTPTGAATLTGTVGRHTLSAAASRRIEQTYGVGAVGINRMLGLVYRLELARWAAFTLTGTDNHSSAPDATTVSDGHSATAGFDFPLSAEVSLRTTYSYWEQRDTAHARDWRDHTVSVGFSKRFRWR